MGDNVDLEIQPPVAKKTVTVNQLMIENERSYLDPERVYTPSYLEERDDIFRIKLTVGEIYEIYFLERSSLIDPKLIGEYKYNGLIYKNNTKRNIFLSFTCVQEECDDGISTKPSKTNSTATLTWNMFKQRLNHKHAPLELSAEETSGISPKYFFHFHNDSLTNMFRDSRTKEDHFDPPKKGGKRKRKTIRKRRSRKSRRNHARKTRK